MGSFTTSMESLRVKLLISPAMLIMNAVIGLSFTLVESEKVTWGLYKWCSVEEGNVTQCHQIHPGESPAYIEVARFCAAFSVVMMFLNYPIILWKPPDNSTCKWLLKLVFILLPSLNVGTTLGLVGAYYKDDNRWKDSSYHILTGAFYFIAILAVVDFLSTCLFLLCFACELSSMISDQQTRRQRQGHRSRPPPNAEPISNQGERNQTRCCQKLNSAKIKPSALWKQLCRKLVIVMKCLQACICGKRLSRKPFMTMESLMTRIFGKRPSRKLGITVKRLGPGTVQDLPDNPLHHQPGQPGAHGSPPTRHAPGGPAGDVLLRIDQNDASDTSSVRAGHSEGAARYNAVNAYRSVSTTIHHTTGQRDRYTTTGSVTLHAAPPEWPGRFTTMDHVIGQGVQEELSHSQTASDAPRVHSICRPQLTLADFHSFVDPETNRLIFQLRQPGQMGVDPSTSTYV